MFDDANKWLLLDAQSPGQAPTGFPDLEALVVWAAARIPAPRWAGIIREAAYLKADLERPASVEGETT